MQQKYVLSKNQLQKTIKTFSTYFFHKMFLQHLAKHFFFFFEAFSKHFLATFSKASKKQI